MRKAFNFYRSYYDVAKELSKEARAAFLWAVLQRQFEGIEPELDGQANFAYISQKHSIDSQVTGYQTKTGATLAPSVGGSVGGSVGARVQEKGKGEEKGEYTPFDFSTSLINLGFKKQLVGEWLEVRKKKKAVNSETAFNAFISQVKKTGKDKNLVLKLCVVKSWSGFKAGWYEEIDEVPSEVCPYTPEQIKDAKRNMAGFNSPGNWFDMKWKHLLQ